MAAAGMPASMGGGGAIADELGTGTSGSRAGAAIGGSAGAAGTPATSGAGAGGSSGGGDAAGSAGASAPAEPEKYECTQIYGGSRDGLWFSIFEQQGRDAEWQSVFLAGSSGGYLEDWAEANNPNYARSPDSPCASQSSTPERVVFALAGWMEANQQEYYAHIASVVEQLKTRFPGVRRIELATAVRAPGNQTCHDDIRTTVPPAQDAAIAQVVAENPDLLTIGHKFEAESCAYFSGHNITSVGAAGFARQAIAYYAD
jgi:hypothetical protein